MNKKIIMCLISTILIVLLSCVVFGTSAASGIIDSSYVEASLIGQNPDPAEPGDIVEIRFNVWNGGYGILENVEFQLVPEWPLSFVSGQSSKIQVGDLKTEDFYGDKVDDKTALLFYRLKVDPSATTGDYQVKLKYTVENKFNQGQKLPVYNIRVESSTSLLDIESFSTIPEKIKPGESGELLIKLTNKGGIDLKDLKLKLDLNNVDFSPIGSTNEKLVKSLERDHSTVIKYNLLASGNMKAKEYQIPIDIEFEDDDNNAYDKNNTVTILMDSTPSYLLNLEQSDVFVSNTKGKVVISLSNTGQSDLKYLNLEVLDTDSYEVLGKRSEYLGNLESDDFETADFQLFVKKINFIEDNEKRNVPLNVRISYKDSYNTDYSDEGEINLPIYTKSAAKKYDLVKGGMSGVQIFFILIIIAGVGYYIYRKKRKNNNNNKK
ncbi:hypothetical protein HOC35_04155 [Candidatus Woesearchaeota archaeon]|jgi:hypothetical protein|nr:hypothetical protein [Candidatus Woesearchaeota archaeon]